MPFKKPSKRKSSARAPSRASTVSRPQGKRPKLELLQVPARKTVKGTVLVCGQNDYGQLGLGLAVLQKLSPTVIPCLTDIVEICAGGMHSVCLTSTGKVITFGCNDDEALGRYTPAEREEDVEFEATPGYVHLPEEAVQISAGDNHSAALLKNGRVFFWGSFRDSQGILGLTLKLRKAIFPVELLPGVKCTQIASGANHLAALTENGQVYTIGCPEQGQLGRLGIRLCKRNASRQGVTSLLTPKPVCFKVTSKIFATEIWAGNYSTLARDRGSDKIYAAGPNNFGQLGLQNAKQISAYLPEESFAFRRGLIWKHIAAGPQHTLALDENGTCHSLGRNDYGMLGIGQADKDATDLTLVPILENKKCVNVSCGEAYSFAVADDGSVYSWGMNEGGILGIPATEDQLEPVLVQSKSLARYAVIQVSCGGQHTMMLAKPRRY